MGRYRLRDKYVLVTGASSGIGREIARCMAERGANLILGSLPDEVDALEDLARELADNHGVKTWTVAVDLAEDDGPLRVFEQVKRLTPHLDVLVNNAGLITYGHFWEMSPDKIDTILRVNVRAYMTLMRLFLPGMVQRGTGRILNVNSAASFSPTCFHAVYGAGKAFTQSLSGAVRAELRGAGVTVCALNPAYVDTPLLQSDGFPEKLHWYKIAGLQSPAKIAAKGVKALCRGKATYIPGLINWLSSVVLTRITPRRLQADISYLVLRGAGKRGD